MNDVMTNAAGIFNAVAYYIKASVSFLVSNPLYLGASLLVIGTAGKSLKLGRMFSFKGDKLL